MEKLSGWDIMVLEIAMRRFAKDVVTDTSYSATAIQQIRDLHDKIASAAEVKVLSFKAQRERRETKASV